MTKGDKRVITLGLSFVLALASGNAHVAKAAEVYTGSQMTEEQKVAVSGFLNDLELTDDFAVYADTMVTDGEGRHVDGNAAVNEVVTTDNNTGEIRFDANTRGAQSEEGYSYVGSGIIGNTGENATKYQDALIVGDDVTYASGESFEAWIEEKGINVIHAGTQEYQDYLEENPEIAEQLDINGNLVDIAESGEALQDAFTTAQEKIVEDAEKEAIETFDTITQLYETENGVIVANLDVSALTNGSYTAYDSLIRMLQSNTNNVVTMINLDVDEDETSLVFNTWLNNVDCDANASANSQYLIWNFGNYDGEIKVNATQAGVFVAPNAAIINSSTVCGAVVADTYIISNAGNEVHGVLGRDPLPTEAPTATPTEAPTATPTAVPTTTPTEVPTATPTEAPTATPTEAPTATPTEAPTVTPTVAPTATPTVTPTVVPTATPTALPTVTPTEAPTATPTVTPTALPTEAPTALPTEVPTEAPTATPTEAPTATPTVTPTPDPVAEASGSIAIPDPEPTVTPDPEPTATPIPDPEPEVEEIIEIEDEEVPEGTPVMEEDGGEEEEEEEIEIIDDEPPLGLPKTGLADSAWFYASGAFLIMMGILISDKKRKHKNA